VRLGFARAEMAAWLAAAGLDHIEAFDLVPYQGDGAGKLTVTVWVAKRSVAAGRGAAQPTGAAEMESTP
jgi:hypothetical protein